MTVIHEVWRRQMCLQYCLQAALGLVVEAATPTRGDSMILVAVLLCTLLRGVRMQENKIAAITLLTHAAKYCDDDTRLQRIVPYLLVRRTTRHKHAWCCL